MYDKAENAQPAPQGYYGGSSGGGSSGGGSSGGGGQIHPNKPGRDPMHISVGDLLLSWCRLQDEKRFRDIEISRLKLRVAELEHERAIVLS